MVNFPFLLMLSSDSGSPTTTDEVSTHIILDTQIGTDYESSYFRFLSGSESSNAPSILEQVRFFSPQGTEALQKIGPVDAAICGLIGIGLAEYYAYQRFPEQDISSGNRNAYRHCYGSCLSYQIIGEEALVAMDIHEKYGPGEGCDDAIDALNNNIGVKWAKSNPDGSCLNYCDTAISQRVLALDCENIPNFNSSQIETVSQ